MPRKSIQLRGISRTPSDRMSADGGCAESINLKVEEDELAPSFIGTDVTVQLVGNAPGRVVFVHKTGGNTNYVAFKSFYYSKFALWKAYNVILAVVFQSFAVK